MFKFKKDISFVLLFTCIWFILSEGQGGLINISIGIAISYFCLKISSNLLNFDYSKTFYLPVTKVLKYFFYMIFAIYKAGILTSYCIITNKADPTFIDITIDKRIENPFLQHIIGNSITLTPGTITISNQEGKLKVLCLHHNPSDESPSAPFEERMLKLQHKEEK